MADTNFFEDLSEEQKKISSRVFDLVLGRVLKKVYANFDERTKEGMDKVFSSDNDEDKENFVKKHIPGFKKLFEEEAQKLEKELKEEVIKQL